MPAELHSRQANSTKGVRGLALMSFSALGIIYSDIGTSPLYVLNGIWPASGEIPSPEDVIGAISTVVWTLTLLPLVKYSLIALCFGTKEGEGGVFALFTNLFPRAQSVDGDRQLTAHSLQDAPPKPPARWLGKAKWWLMVWALFGTALILADGVLTPAVSVISAVGGIAVAQPSIIDSVVGISAAFLAGLFLIQRFGTHKIAFMFAPISAIWLALLGITGAINIAKHPAIFRVFDPSRAILFFVRTGNFDALAGILLSVTGSEAIFANLGQFTPASIRIGFVFTWAMLVLQYMGQGARLIVDGPAVLPSVFYQSIPGKTGGGLYWFVFVVAVLACLVASQAMITATFSLIQQLIAMQACPQFRVKHTSAKNQGQIYFAAINYLLLIAVICVVAGFGTEYALTNAYGFSVSTVMFVTDTFLALSILYTTRLPIPWLFAAAYFLFFGFIDACFWGVSLRKVPVGGWFSLGLGGILTLLLAFYTWGRNLEERFDDSHRTKLSDIVSKASDTGRRGGCDEKEYAVRPDSVQEEDAEESGTSDEDLVLTIPGGYLDLPRISTCAFFQKAAGSRTGVPHVFYAFLRRWPALPRVVVFLSTIRVGDAHVDVEDRYIITKVRSLQGFYGVTVRLGYRDDLPNFSREIIPRIVQLETTYDLKGAALNVAAINTAALNSTYILPNNVLSSRPSKLHFIRRVLVEELYARIRVMFPDQQTVAKGSDEVIRVGVNAAI